MSGQKGSSVVDSVCRSMLTRRVEASTGTKAVGRPIVCRREKMEPKKDQRHIAYFLLRGRVYRGKSLSTMQKNPVSNQIALAAAEMRLFPYRTSGRLDEIMRGDIMLQNYGGLSIMIINKIHYTIIPGPFLLVVIVLPVHGPSLLVGDTSCVGSASDLGIESDENVKRTLFLFGDRGM